MTTYLLVLIITVSFALIASFFRWLAEGDEQSGRAFVISWAVVLVLIFGSFMLGVRHAKATPIKWSQDIKEPTP